MTYILKKSFFALTFASGLAGASYEAMANDIPDQTAHSSNQAQKSPSMDSQRPSETTQSPKAKKESWLIFKPFYPDPERRIRFSFPGGSANLPIVKGSIWGALGTGCWAFLPYPFNYVLGFPLLGLGFGTEFYPLGKPVYHRAVFGGSVFAVTAVATIVSIVLGGLNDFNKSNRPVN